MSSLNSKPNFTSAVAKSASGNCTVTVEEEAENNNSIKANSRKLAPSPVGKAIVSEPLKGQLEVTTTTETTPSGGPDKQQCVVGSLTDFEEAELDHFLWAASRPRYNRSTSESNVNAPVDATDGRQTSVAAKSLSSSSQKLLSGYFREAESRINLEDFYAGEKVKFRSRPFGGTVPRRRSALVDRDRNQCSARSEHETMSLSSAATALHQRQQAIQQCGMSAANAPLMKQHVADVDSPIDVFNSSAFSTAKPLKYKEEVDFSRLWHQEEEEKEKGEEAEETVAEAVKQYGYKQLSNVRCVSPSNKTIELQSLDGDDEDGVLGQTAGGEEDEHSSAKKRDEMEEFSSADSLADSVPPEVLSQFPHSAVFLPRGDGGQYVNRGSFLPSYNNANTNNSMSMRGKRHSDWQSKPRANRTKGPQPVCAEQIEGYRGAESLDAIIDYVEGRGGGNQPQQQQLKSSNPTSPQSGVQQQQQSKKKKAARSSSLQMQNAPNHAVSSGESTASAEGDRSVGEEQFSQDQEAETTLVDGEVTLAATPNANTTTDSSVTSGLADEEADVEETSREVVIAEGRTLDLNDDRLYLKDDDPLPSTTPTPSLDGEFQVVQSKKKERQRTKKLTPRYSLDQQQAALAGRARAVRAVTPPLTVSSPASSAVSPPQSATKGGPSHVQYGGGPFGSRGVRGGPKFGNSPPKAKTADHRVRRNSGPPVDDAASFPPLSVVVLSNADAADTMEYAKSEGGEASEHKPSWASVAGGSTRGGGPKVGGSSSSASSTTAPSPAPNAASANIEELQSAAAKNEQLLVVELAREEERLEAGKIVEAEVVPPPPPAKVELNCCEATTNVEIFGSPPTGEQAVDVSFGFDESLPENCWTGVGTTEQNGDGFVLMTGADGQEIRIFHPPQQPQQSGLSAPTLQASSEHVRLREVMMNDWADFLDDEPYHLSDIQERILSTKCRSGNNTGTDAGNRTG